MSDGFLPAEAFNELKARIPALDDSPDAHEEDTAEQVLDKWAGLLHAILDCIAQHNDEIRPRYFPVLERQ